MAFSGRDRGAPRYSPLIFTDALIRQALEFAGELGRFEVDAVSPERAAARLTIPVLLIHGANDVETSPAHSRRVFDALKGPKRLVLVPGAGHNASLRSEVWQQVEAWIDQVLATAR